MELRYTYILILGIILCVLVLLFTKKKKGTKKSGLKIANTQYIKKSAIYQKLLRKYHLNITILYSLLAIALLSSLTLISRPSSISTDDDLNMNRDIILCMDLSSSVDDLNAELVDNLKSTVSSLKGERFGITIFNATSVMLVPLTDDYEYVLDVLDTIHKALTQELEDMENDDYFYLRNYITSGTVGGDRGSSLIGDGLAACTFNFSEDKDRTKIIIFSTDNDLAGKPIVTLDKAADISKSRNVIVYGIGPDFISSKKRTEFENAVKKTGGKYYDQDDDNTVKSIVKDIESTSKSLLKGVSSTRQIDEPLIPFIILVVSILGTFIISKKVAK